MRLLLKLLAIAIAIMIGGIMGWLIGAYIGGNYFVDFTFSGIRGYEATGQVGFLFGSIGGGVLCWFITFKPSRK